MHIKSVLLLSTLLWVFQTERAAAENTAARVVDSLPATPLQSLQKAFSDPGKAYGSVPLWVWNTKVTKKMIDSALQAFKHNAFGGVFVHPRAGLITEYLSPEWFDLWKYTTQRGKELGLDIWIYDEDSYPSGFAGGHVPDAMPSSFNQGEMLELHKFNSLPPDSTQYYIRLKTDSGYYLFKKTSYYTSPWYGGFSYVDLMAKGVTREFIHQTMSGYERSVGSEFGKTVKGIFSDEPNIEVQYPNSLRWTPGLFDAFYSKWNYHLENELPSLLEETGRWKKVRHDYYETLLQLFIDGWSKPYSAYAQSKHLEWTGHYWEHEWPDPNHVPDNMAMYAWPQRPGIDLLFNQFNEHYVNAQFGNIRAVKELASVANQLGKHRTLCETYGGGGWELGFKDMKRLGDWEFTLGINTLDQHLSFMSITGARKYDYPQSFSYHTPWWPYYKYLNRYFARLSWALSQGQQQNKIVIIEPTTTTWMYAAHDAANPKMMSIGSGFQSFVTRLEKAQVEYDLASENIIRDHGKVIGRQFIIGERAYTTVVIPPGLENVDSATYLLLKQYVAAGGKVLQYEKWDRLDGDSAAISLPAAPGGNLVEINAWDTSIVHPWLGTDHFDISTDTNSGGDLHHMRRILPDGMQLLFLSNADMQVGVEGHVSLPGKDVLCMDLFNGTVTAYPHDASGNGVTARFHLPPAGSLLLLVTGKRSPGIRPYAGLRIGAASGQTRSLSDDGLPTTLRVVPTAPTKITQPENSLMIDFCDVHIGDTLLKDRHVYDAADTVFKHYGFSDGDPWNTSVQYKDNTVRRDTFRVGTGFIASYHFNIAEGINTSEFRAVVEQPGLWEVSVNGHLLHAEKGKWWLDKDFGVYAAGNYLHSGDNVLVLTTNPMSVFAEIEPVYILGNFGLASAAKGWRIVAPQPLHIGSWKDQGLPLYGKSVSYEKECFLKKPEGHYILRLGKWNGTVAAVKVNGREAGIIILDPYVLDITPWMQPGRNHITVEVVGSLKNLLGPHHSSPAPGLVSPWHWRYVKGYPSGSEYDTRDYGLMEDFELTQVLELKRPND